MRRHLPPSPRARSPRARRLALVSVAVAALTATLAVPASAAEGSIDHVEPGKGSFQVLYSLPGSGSDASPDLESLKVTLNGDPLPAKAELAAYAAQSCWPCALEAITPSRSASLGNP